MHFMNYDNTNAPHCPKIMRCVCCLSSKEEFIYLPGILLTARHVSIDRNYSSKNAWNSVAASALVALP